MAEQGYLDGSRMAAVFNMLRPRDLIWPYVVNNYLLGKKPFPFDLLYWNADSTRLPAANHAFYLREFYHLNRLSKGELKLGGVKLDLKRVKIPIYELAAREDHIAPASSVFIGSKLFGGPVRFVMSGSGHIAPVPRMTLRGVDGHALGRLADFAQVGMGFRQLEQRQRAVAMALAQCLERALRAGQRLGQGLVRDTMLADGLFERAVDGLK